ncbi:hypothetical protein L208DRAFT_892839 [Tricholoma matsutake]|nr:hypothetical protein L208DRAFT_892839 [Tricholoma matsutake 945]
MASDSEKHGTRGITESGTTADSSDSGQGSEPLSNPYVAVEVGKGTRNRASHQVKVPEGAAQFGIRDSARVASAKSKCARATPPGPALVEAPPGMKPSVGYKYQVLQPVLEGSRKISRQSGRPTDPSENAGGSRDTATTQASSKVGTAAMTGRKCSATNDAPGSLDRRRNPVHLASAADFSPTHFEEPQSDGLLGAWLEVAPQNRHDVVAEEVGTRTTGGSHFAYGSGPEPSLQRNRQSYYDPKLHSDLAQSPPS